MQRSTSATLPSNNDPALACKGAAWLPRAAAGQVVGRPWPERWLNVWPNHRGGPTLWRMSVNTQRPRSGGAASVAAASRWLMLTVTSSATHIFTGDSTMTAFPITFQRRWLIIALGAVVAALALVVTAGPAAARSGLRRRHHTGDHCQRRPSRAYKQQLQRGRRHVQSHLPRFRPDDDATRRHHTLPAAGFALMTRPSPTIRHGPTFTGQEQVLVSMLSNSATTTTSFVLHFWATGSDGSRAAFKEVEHLTIAPAASSSLKSPS